MRSVLVKSGGALAAALAAVVLWYYLPSTPEDWTDDEIVILRSLTLAALPKLPPDPSNAVADNAAAAVFGARLFMDTRLSANGEVSCASCHQPARRFTDGLRKGEGVGTSSRNTPSIVGSAYSPWLYWDGRRDSQWSQALSPLEDPNEHGSSRLQVAELIARDETYRESYLSLFGELPEFRNDSGDAVNVVFANVGKAIAAFERTIMPTPSRFDDYVAAVVDGDIARQKDIFSDDEIHGLRFFIGAASCTRCHNGPLLTNNEFHNTGVISYPGEVPDKGRASGVLEVLESQFNCRSEYSDDEVQNCSELRFVRTGSELIGAVRTPSLRNIEGTAPYMHKGQLTTLAEVLVHYNVAPEAMIGHNEAEPLGLTSRQLEQLEAFLHTLTAPVGGALN